MLSGKNFWFSANSQQKNEVVHGHYETEGPNGGIQMHDRLNRQAQKATSGGRSKQEKFVLNGFCMIGSAQSHWMHAIGRATPANAGQ